MNLNNRLTALAVAAWMIGTAPAWGQITVNESDLPQGGSSYTFQNLALDVLVDFEASGPGWVWDFSDQVPADSTVQDVFDIGSASFTTALIFNSPWDPDHQADHFYQFLALPDFGDLGGQTLPIDLDEIMGYHQIANGTYTQVGLGLTLSGFEVPVAFEDVDEVHPVPLTADATLESTSAYVVDVPQTFTYAVDQTRMSVVDGYGTLLLPDGTSHEVLRLKSTVTSNDSVYVGALDQGIAFERETVTYTWLSDGGMPWMEVSTTLGVPTTVRYQGSAPASETNGVFAATSDRTFLPVPNPARVGEVVNIGTDAAATWVVRSLDGAVVARGKGNRVSTAGWARGMYLMQNEATGMTRRLVVQ